MREANYICARCYGSFKKTTEAQSLDDAKRAEYSTEENLGIICEPCHQIIAEQKVQGEWTYNFPKE